MPKFLAIFFLFACSNVFSQTTQLYSPDKAIRFQLERKHQSLFYNIYYKNTPVITASPLSLRFDKDSFGTHISMDKPVFTSGVETYDLVVGKSSHVRDPYNEVLLSLRETSTTKRRINLRVRAFNNGLAFRYEFPLEQNNTSLTLLDENSTFHFAGDAMMHALLFPNYTTSHEGIYSHLRFSELKEDTLIDIPSLFEINGVYVAVTEAALLDYPGMYLSKHNGILMSKLSPLPGQTAIKAQLKLPHVSPWRVVLMSDRVGALIESNIITSLNASCAIKDLTWIHPGKTTFPWWNGNVTPDTLNAPGNNFVTQQYYIDFCARNGIEYHSVVEYGLHQWYTDDGVGFQPGPHADVTTPVPGLDMKQVCDYAISKGVGIRVWVHWAALYPKLDAAFAIFEKWGIKGMMVDFMDRDDQQMVNIQTEILQKAAQHHLHIQFHGAYKPTGLSRTYPNEYTREGTLNYEIDKWDDKGLSPDDDINIPFTRMLAGSTDYHLGGFRAVTQEKYKTQYTRPLVLGTRCHMLGMYVVLENYLQMVCDYPAAYEGEPGFEFIKNIPTTWDETKVLDARVGAFITVARKKNDNWYIGTITNRDARTISVPLQFLDEGAYTAETYTDANDVAINPNHLKKETRKVTAKDELQLSLAGGGGAVIRLMKMKN